MKNVKRIFAALAGIAMVLALVTVPSVATRAEEAKTWYVTYDTGTGKWYSSNDKQTWSVYDLTKFAAGDSIVIDADGQDVPQLTVVVYQPANEVAFINKASATVTAPSANHVYAVLGAVGVFNGNVTKVDAYGNGVVQINGNVDTFVANYTSTEEKIMFGVSGTVRQANVKCTGNRLDNKKTIYNVKAGKFYPNASGVVELKDDEYTTDPAAAPAPAATAATPAATPQLDKVPKTGAFGVSESLIFFGLATVFAVGAVVYKKKANN